MIYPSIFYQLHLWLRIFHNISVQFHPQPTIQKHACKLQTSVYTLIFSLFQNTHHWISWSSREFGFGWLVSINLHIIEQEPNITMACTDQSQTIVFKYSNINTCWVRHIVIKQDIVHIILFNNILIQQFFTWNSVIPAIDTIKNS